VTENPSGTIPVDFAGSAVTLDDGWSQPVFVQPTNEVWNGPLIEIESGADRSPSPTAVTGVFALWLTIAIVVYYTIDN